VETACTRWAQNPRVSAEHLINDMQSIRDSATKASTNITKLADNVSTWWTNLDPVQHASPSPEEHGRQSTKAQVGLAFKLQTLHPKTWQSKIAPRPLYRAGCRGSCGGDSQVLHRQKSALNVGWSYAGRGEYPRAFWALTRGGADGKL